MALGGIPLADLQLGMSSGLPDQTWNVIVAALHNELRRQEANPPALPESRVPDLAPKQREYPWENLPIDATPEFRAQIERLNNDIAERNKATDRQRNNLAAKKSRELRIEQVRDSRVFINDLAAENAWLRLKVLTLGGNLSAWDNLGASQKARINQEIADRVLVIEQQRKEASKTRQRANRLSSQVYKSVAKRSRGEQLNQDDHRNLQRYDHEMERRMQALDRRSKGMPPIDDDAVLLEVFDKQIQAMCYREAMTHGQQGPDDEDDEDDNQRLEVASVADSAHQELNESSLFPGLGDCGSMPPSGDQSEAMTQIPSTDRLEPLGYEPNQSFLAQLDINDPDTIFDSGCGLESPLHGMGDRSLQFDGSGT